jgi:hypothetical protein
MLTRIQSLGVRMPTMRSQAWISMAVLGGAVWLAWVVGGLIAAGDPQSLIFSALGLVVCVVAVATIQNWRLGFYLFLAWMLFEDLFRKYLGNNTALFFAKDVLVGIVFVSFLLSVRRRRDRLFRPPFLLWLSLFFWLAFVEVFNPNSPNVLYGFMGMKMYFYYFPLIFVGYVLIRNSEDLDRFMVFNMWFASIIAGLGIIQAITGPTFLTPTDLAPELRELGTLERYSPITYQKVFRPTSVFVSDGRFAWFLLLMWLLALGALGFALLRRGRAPKVYYLATGLLTLAIFLSGVRTTFVVTGASVVILFAAFLWGAPWRWGTGQRLVRAMRRSIIFGAAGILLGVLLYPEALGARLDFYSETLSPSGSHSELVSRGRDYATDEFIQAFSRPNWTLGNGTGTLSLSTQYVDKLLGEHPLVVGVESGYGGLMLEMGVLGVLLWIAWTLATVVACWRVVERLRQTVYFPMGMVIFWFVFILLIPFSYNGMTAFQNYIYNAYLWLLLGILFRLPSLVGQPEIAANSANGH